jgi:phenylacetate-CoA ligase
MPSPKKTPVTGPGWPSFPPVPLELKAVLAGLKVSQWWPPGELATAQYRQLAWLLRYAGERIPHYRNAGWAALLAARMQRATSLDERRAMWREVPLLSKPQVRQLGTNLETERVPAFDLPLGTLKTSGSTGIPVTTRSTATTRAIWDALTIREHLWSRREFVDRMGVIRFRDHKDRGNDGQVRTGWGKPVGLLYRSGPSSAMHIGRPMAELAAWLRRFDPRYLLAYPSIMDPLMDEVEAQGGRPPTLEEVRFISEPLDDSLRERLQAEWQVRSTDLYSANEVGYIAFRCREQGTLHVQAESILVEILDEAGNDCGPGETGRVVLTPLHNLATVLLRYDIGDYATVAPPCACGRTLLPLRAVQGRVRNLVRTPDGRRYWPVALGRLRGLVPVIQAQFVQTALDHVELRVVLSRPLTEEERADAVTRVHKALGHPFHVTVVPLPEIPRGPTGKFEEFLSLLPEE